MSDSIVYTSLIYSLAALANNGSGGGGGTTGGTVSLSIGTVETLPAGSQAYVTNIGTDEEQVWNIGIPQGADGKAGTDGVDGLNGSKWYVSNEKPGTAVSGMVDGDFVLYQSAQVYTMQGGKMVDTSVNIAGSKVIPVNTAPSPVVPIGFKENDSIIFNDGSWWRVVSGVLVNTGINLKGPSGFSPTIEVKEDTDDSYVLTITNETGSFDTPNLKGSGGTGTGVSPYDYAVQQGYTGTKDQFNTAYMNAIRLTEKETGIVVLDGGYSGDQVTILDGGTADSWV